MSDEMIEVSRARLSAAEGSAKLMDSLWNDPKYGLKIKEFTKEKFPNANIPEVDTIKHVRKTEEDLRTSMSADKKAVEDLISGFRKEREDEKSVEKEARETARFQNDVEATKKKYQLSAEGMEKVFARMHEKNNPDVEAAAAWVTDHEQAAKPLEQPGYGSQSMDFQNSFNSTQEDKDWELLNKDPFDMKFADQEIRRITADFANGRGDLYGANGMGGQL